MIEAGAVELAWLPEARPWEEKVEFERTRNVKMARKGQSRSGALLVRKLRS
jgi:hypothetical protein